MTVVDKRRQIRSHLHNGYVPAQLLFVAEGFSARSVHIPTLEPMHVVGRKLVKGHANAKDILRVDGHVRWEVVPSLVAQMRA